MRILVIEDEPRMLELLRKGLQEHQCAVITATDGETGLEIASDFEFDAIVLDIGLPRRDGYSVISALRERSSTARVLMLTARDGEDNIIRGLDLGADDYLTKPFAFPELVARLQSVTRGSRLDGRTHRIEAGDLVVDPVRRLAMRRNRPIDLSRSEFNLLLALARSAGRCVSRQELMECVWGRNPEVGAGALDVLVNSLRGKVDALPQLKLIHTIRGSGYLLSEFGQPAENTR
jgi:DNA-binding response OmpR family regulator